ncbi:MAG: hypothetical protein JXD22_04140 [Sedimentisphaerales bacterium]|nr:hypothetical protein [Sedimentisphaerales bacterium]
MKTGVGDFGMMRSEKEFGADRRRDTKKTYRSIIIIGVMLGVSLGALPVQGQFGGGTGEPNEPFLIYDAAQLQTIGANSGDWDKHSDISSLNGFAICNKDYTEKL